MLTLSVLTLIGLLVITQTEIIKREIMKKSPIHLKLIAQSDSETFHEIVISVKQNNLEILEELLIRKSTPGSEEYQKWMTFQEVGSLIANDDAYTAIVCWLDSTPEVSKTWESPRREFLKANAPIRVWESVLDTKFYRYQDLSQPFETYHNIATDYTIPAGLEDHISFLHNTVQIPPIFEKKSHKRDVNGNEVKKENVRVGLHKSVMGTVPVTVSFLNSLYDIPSNVVSDSSISFEQAVFETNQESFSQADLITFQNTYGLTLQAAEAPFGYDVSSSDCATTASCSEGNLDIQYIMGVAQNVATVFWYTGGSNPFLTWILDVASDPNPPLANSISWGAIEFGQSESTLSSFNTEAMKLGLIGVTILVSTGDNGAPNSYNDQCLCAYDSSSNQLDWSVSESWTGTGYFPSFPATSPFVTAVGATMGPNSGAAEVACQSQQGGLITTGGGFSTYFPTPSWQSSQVLNYFNNLGGSQPSSGYNPNGRGYPDISFIGVAYSVIVGGTTTYAYGTSCSAPVFAAMVSLTNAIRIANGNASLGFLNPTIYSSDRSSYFTDITSGNNKCCLSQTAAGATCCNSGFSTSSGWDPVTGMGSLTFPSMAMIFANEVIYTPTPTASPVSSNMFSFTTVMVAIGLACVALISVILCIHFCLCGRWKRAASAATSSNRALATPLIAHNYLREPNFR